MGVVVIVLTCNYNIRYQFQTPFFLYRDFCIILTDDANATTTACLTLLFIGYNDDPPMITYTSEGVASFIEGQAEYVPVINGTITIRDQDHPTRYAILLNYNFRVPFNSYCTIISI